MIQSKNKKGRIYLALCLILTLFASIANFLLLKFNSDVTDIDGVYQSVLFRSGALSNSFYTFLVASVALFFSAGFVLRKNAHEAPSGKTHIARTFLRAAAGMALLFTLPLQYILKTADTPYALNHEAFSIQNSSSLQKVSLVLALFGAFYFLLPFFYDKKSKGMTIIKTALGLSVVFFCCAQLLVTHEYNNEFLFSPTRIYSLCSYCFIVFFILSELRLSLPGRAKPWLYGALGMTVFFLTVVECLPILLLSFMSSTGYSLGLGTFYLLIRLFIGVYALISAAPTLMTTTVFAMPKEEEKNEDQAAVQAPAEGEEEKEEENTPLDNDRASLPDNTTDDQNLPSEEAGEE